MQIEKPIFIVGAHRSGTTWLGRVLEQHPEIACWNEIRHVWFWGNFEKSKIGDILTADDFDPKIQAHIENKFAGYLKKKVNSVFVIKHPATVCEFPL